MKLKASLVVIAFVFMVTTIAAISASQGSLSTYLPMAFNTTMYELPEGNLILYSTWEMSVGDDLYIGVPPPAQEGFRLTTRQKVGYQSYATFSPDGQQVVYISDPSDPKEQELVIMAADASGRFTLPRETEGSNMRHEGWSSDSRFLAYGERPTNLPYYLHITDSETKISRLIAEDFVQNARWDPINAHRLFYVGKEGDIYHIYRLNADGSEKSSLMSSDQFLILWGIMADGHLVVRRAEGTDDNLWLVNPDTGAAARLTNDSLFEGNVTVSPVGDKIFISRGPNPQTPEEIAIINGNGTEVWRYDIMCDDDFCPVSYKAWAPDATEVAFSWGKGSLYTVAADGSQSTPTLIVETNVGDMGYSPDGRYLAYDDGPRIQVLDRETGVTLPLYGAERSSEFFDWRPMP